MKKILLVLGTVLVVGILSVLVVIPALAQNAESTPPPAGSYCPGYQNGGCGGYSQGGVANSVLSL